MIGVELGYVGLATAQKSYERVIPRYGFALLGPNVSDLYRAVELTCGAMGEYDDFTSMFVSGLAHRGGRGGGRMAPATALEVMFRARY